MRRGIQNSIIAAIALAVVGGLGWLIWQRILEQADEAAPMRGGGPVPVEVAEVSRGPIVARRTFSGTLESKSEFQVSPKVGGRIERLTVDLADEVTKGQVVAELDSDEYQQEVAQAEADLAVAQANLAEAISALEIAERELQRIQTLQQRGVTSESQYDVAKADELAKRARVEVAKAQVTRAESSREAARIRLGYTTVVASWTGEGDQRVVAERYVEVGDTIGPNTPLMSIVALDPIQAVVYVTERDYARLASGQAVTLKTDAFPGEQFVGEVSRVAPVFRQASRQARVELVVSNPQHRLKPGMFIRAETILDRVDDAIIVPVEAIVKRGGQTNVFVVEPGGDRVRLETVVVGIEDGGRAQIVEGDVDGLVVTLGQQLLEDGSSITIPDRASAVSLGAAGHGEITPP